MIQRPALSRRIQFILYLCSIFLSLGLVILPAYARPLHHDNTSAQSSHHVVQSHVVQSHVVQQGDTLTNIAARYGTSVDVIIQANGILNPNHIMIGQSLVIPTQHSAHQRHKPHPGPPKSHPKSSSHCSMFHIVRSSEFLSGIAVQYGVNMDHLAQINNIHNVNHLYAGQKLCIPSFKSSYSPPPHNPSPPIPTAAQVPPHTTPIPKAYDYNTPPRKKHQGSWVGEYFSNMELAGEPVYTQNDPKIEFSWRDAAPSTRLPADQFSVRWTRVAYFERGTYRFDVKVDDGVIVKINGETVIDAWRDQHLSSYHKDVPLEAGTHTVQVEYYDKHGGAYIHVEWFQY